MLKSALALLFLGWIALSVPAEAPAFKVRAIWAPPTSFASPAATDEMLARCGRAGINLILPNVMSHGTVLFRSSHIHGRVAANDEFDPLANLIRKAHAANIKVEAWSCVYYEGAGRNSKRSSNRDWFNLSIDGRPFEQDFLSPSNPEVNPYLLSVIKDLLPYDLDGIHLDYIRYPGTAFDYSEAGRKAFKADSGFDPQDFLDHPERIVPPEQEKFPVRVLHPASFAEKVWELTYIERALDQGGVGFAYLSEEPGLLEQLRVPSLLILSSCYDVSPTLAQRLTDYVARGGNLLWTDAPGGALAKSQPLQDLLGLSGGRWVGERRIALRPVAGQSFAHLCPTNSFRTESSYDLRPNGAAILANLESGSPAITLKTTGKGRVMVMSFHLMKTTSPAVAEFASSIVNWFKSEAGVPVADPLAAKRREWVSWRGNRVTLLVRDISRAAKRHHPGCVISSSGGPSPFEFYGCYRDSGRWLAEGINDQLFPMNYTPDPAVFSDMLELQKASAPAGKCGSIYPGLQLYISRTVNGKRATEAISANIVEQELRLVQQHGYEGFCLFAYNYLTDEIIDAIRKFTR